MKKSLMAVALLGAFAGAAQAQTAVQIYGTIDAGLVKQSGQSLSIGKRASNTLGFKGTEDLGNGLKALFQLEIRYEPDTGTLERTNRPLFQGQSRVGLQGDFGMVRIGRGLTPFQETIGAFDPWHAVPTAGGFYTDLTVAGYTSQPLDARGTGNNRWANAFWYNSPVIGGFQLNTAIATKENNGGPASPATAPGPAAPIQGRNPDGTPPQFAVGAPASANPFSVTGTYNNGPVAVMFGYERNAIETKVYAVGLSFMVTPELKLMSTATRQDQGHTVFGGAKTRAWVLGANYALGPGKLLAGYGQKDPDFGVVATGATKTKQMSLGYEYSLSKRTYLYVDASRRKNPEGAFGGTRSVNYYDLGVNHSF